MDCHQSFLALLILLIKTTSAAFIYGVLQSENEKYCAGYLSSLPLQNERSAVNYTLVVPGDGEIDENCTTFPAEVNGSIVVIPYSSYCRPSDAVVNVRSLQGAGIIFYGDRFKNIENISFARTDSKFVIAFISSETYSVLNLNVSGKLYFQNERFFDYSLVILGILAITLVYTGSWSNETYLDVLLEAFKAKSDGETEKSKPAFCFSIVMGTFISGLFLIFIISMLYFLYNVMVYFIEGLFLLLSIWHSFNLLVPLVRKSQAIHKGIVTISIKVPGIEKPLLIYRLVAFLLSCVLPITWICLRHEPYAWSLQDILGCIVCFAVIRKIKPADLTSCIVLFALLLLYDAFAVHLSRFITSDGVSILESIVTGQAGRSTYRRDYETVPPFYNETIREMLPLLFKLPPITAGETTLTKLCFNNNSNQLPKYSMLGFGDIVFPSILSVYACNYDSIHKVPMYAYFHITIIGYITGLITTIVVVYTSQTAQPALLYILPMMLLPFLVIAVVQGDTGHMWKGYNIKLPSQVQNEIEGQSDQESRRTTDVATIQDNLEAPISDSNSDLQSTERHI